MRLMRWWPVAQGSRAKVGAWLGCGSVGGLGDVVGETVGRNVGGGGVGGVGASKMSASVSHDGKRRLRGSTESMSSTRTPNHWATPFHTISHDVDGRILPLRPIDCGPSWSRLEGKSPRICPPRTGPPATNEFPAHP